MRKTSLKKIEEGRFLKKMSSRETEEVEKQVEDYVDNLNMVILCYRLLEDATDKFIVMSCLQLGYKQREVAAMLGIDQVKVSNRLNKSLKFLKDRLGGNII